MPACHLPVAIGVADLFDHDDALQAVSVQDALLNDITAMTEQKEA